MKRGLETVGALVFGTILATGSFGRCNEGTPQAEARIDTSEVSRKETNETTDPLVEDSIVHPKHPTVEEARTQVLSKLQVCRSEFADYWETKADPASTQEILRDAREGYDACIKENKAEGDPSVNTAWDVFESIQSYADRCDGDAEKCERLAEKVSMELAVCTGFQPKKNENFIWRLDEQGEIEGTGTFPGWQLQFEENGQRETLSLMTFPGQGGEILYHYQTISEDQLRGGRASGFDTELEDFCTKLNSYPFVAQ